MPDPLSFCTLKRRETPRPVADAVRYPLARDSISPSVVKTFASGCLGVKTKNRSLPCGRSGFDLGSLKAQAKTDIVISTTLFFW